MPFRFSQQEEINDHLLLSFALGPVGWARPQAVDSCHETEMLLALHRQQLGSSNILRPQLGLLK